MGSRRFFHSGCKTRRHWVFLGYEFLDVEWGCRGGALVAAEIHSVVDGSEDGGRLTRSS